jgi:phosphoribosylformimino-5-aminoimidazole carboxamide ribotide isomerase
MIIYPAIDLRKSQCVRLYQGNYAAETIYSDDPLAMANKFIQSGAKWIHVVDLDAAANPEKNQVSMVVDIIRKSGVNIQTGGGIRDASQIEFLLQQGASRVIIGSMAVQEIEKVKEWISEFGPEKIVLALDVMVQKNAWMVTFNAWKNMSEYTLFDLLEDYISSGLKHVLCTNIVRDGTLIGPDFNLYSELLARFPMLSLQASGGIQCLRDIQALRAQGLAGAIVGRALYENKINLNEAISW